MYFSKNFRSIARNINVDEEILKNAAKTTEISLEHPKEIKLAKIIARFQEIIINVLDDLSLHTLCDYLYELSVVFSEFYDNCYIIEKDKAGKYSILLTLMILQSLMLPFTRIQILLKCVLTL